jgi:hypothetical protein
LETLGTTHIELLTPHWVLTHPGSQKPRKRFTTVPIGPVLQAFYGSHEITDQMHYLERKLAENMNKARLGSGKLSAYDDTACGRELLDAWRAGQFKKTNVALQLSIDGAQLRPDHPSEAWVFIWVIHNVTVARIGATERAIEWLQVEVSCEYGLSHGYDIISLGQSTICTYDVIMTSVEHSGTV